MPYTINFNGIPVTADTPTELIALVDAMKASATKEVSKPSPPSAALPAPRSRLRGLFADISTSAPEILDPRAQKAWKFLTAVQKSGNDGLGTVGMLAVFDVDKPKALGSQTTVVNAVLAELGFDHRDVCIRERGRFGTVFKPGKRIAEAISACAAAAKE